MGEFEKLTVLSINDRDKTNIKFIGEASCLTSLSNQAVNPLDQIPRADIS